jgi:5'-deoxynucleotidase YfbR-like HD superfamily hydrolase
MTWIQTYSGRQFDIAAPTPEMVDLEDIAHSLAMQCRYNGHCQHFYSVAEHSDHVAATVCLAKMANLWISECRYSPTADFYETGSEGQIAAKMRDARRLVRNLGPVADRPVDILKFGYQRLDSADQAEVRAGFLHDGEEAYMKDMPTPIKRMCPEYRALAAPVEAVVFARFGLSAHLPLYALVKAADHEVLFIEKAALLRHEINGWGNTVPRDPRVAVFAQAMSIRCLEPAAAKADFLRCAQIMGIQ